MMIKSFYKSFLQNFKIYLKSCFWWFCPDKSGQALGLDSCFTGFYVSFAGFIIGVPLFLLEIVLSKIVGIDISRHYETVFVPLCHNCRIKTDGNSLIKESP